MRDMDAFEQAYKNGYAAGMKAAEEKIVRCKDCKHHHWEQEPCHGKAVHLCDKFDTEVTKDFFCARGKRREDG